MLFITFEGPEGSGKSTQAKLLYDFVTNELNHDAILTKEPGAQNIHICKKIRELLLDPKNIMHPKTELLLYLADRAQHVSEHIRPALDKGQWVICDRYIDSTFVIQGARGFEKAELSSMIEFACFDLEPTITILFDVPVEVGLKRAKSSNKEFSGGDRIEREPIEFHQNIRNGFLELAKIHQRIKVIDGTQTMEEVQIQIQNIIKNELHNHYFMKYNEE